MYRSRIRNGKTRSIFRSLSVFPQNKRRRLRKQSSVNYELTGTDENNGNPLDIDSNNIFCDIVDSPYRILQVRS